MRFLDEVHITVVSGNGGPGAVSFRREKYVPFGGPDGGNGGRGGHVYVKANQSLNTLIHICANRTFPAENGEKGSGQRCDGRAGEDLVIELPVGTIIRDAQSGLILFDLVEDGQTFMLLKGGLGGLGNAYFKSSTNQTPHFAQSGTPGQTLEVNFELKLMADIGLLGLPNAGKSTLITVISSARPKIADYPFTTLVPNLGVVQVGDDSYVVADIPGLIENASEGKGLGIKFLKHLERTKALVHLVDCSSSDSPFSVYADYVTIRDELEKYSESLTNKKEIVCLTKIDALCEEDLLEYQTFFEEQLQKKILCISAVSGKNIPFLKNLLLKVTKENKRETETESEREIKRDRKSECEESLEAI